MASGWRRLRNCLPHLPCGLYGSVHSCLGPRAGCSGHPSKRVSSWYLQTWWLEHLKFLLRWADHRGSDVRLLTNSVIHGPPSLLHTLHLHGTGNQSNNTLGVRPSTSTCWSLLRCSIFSVCERQLVKSPGNGFFTFSTASWLPRWPPRAGHLHAFSTAFVVVSPLSLFVPAAWWCRSGRCRAGNTATLPAGSRCGGVMVKRRSTHRVLKRHLKFAGIERATEKRYATGVERFCRFSELFFARLPHNGTELNYFLGITSTRMTARISGGWTHMRRCVASFEPGVTTRRWHACTCGIGPEH